MKLTPDLRNRLISRLLDAIDAHEELLNFAENQRNRNHMDYEKRQIRLCQEAKEELDLLV